MGRKYENPPLIEAVCEFRLTPDTAWDLTIPGLLYENIKERFPRREQRLIHELEITTGPEGIQQQVRTSERIFLFAKDDRMFVQLGPRLVAINCLKPYPTWDGYKPEIKRVFESLNQIIEIRGLQRIGLRYINRIDIPGSSIKLEDYFEFYLFLGPRLPQAIASFIGGSEFIYANGRDRCRVQLMSAPPMVPQTSSFTLDIDYFLSQAKGVEVQRAITWVEEAHDYVEEVFEGCINDSLRKLFKEVMGDATA